MLVRLNEIMTLDEVIEDASSEPAAADLNESDPPEVDDPEGDDPEGETPEPAAQFDYKFKVLDEEKEIDPLFRPLIKDKETEQKIREFHERAHGLEHVKADRQALREENTGLKQFQETYSKDVEFVSKAREAAQQGDMESMFRYLGVDDNLIMQRAQQIQQLNQMRENDPASYNAHMQAQHARMQVQQTQENAQAAQSHASDMIAQQIDFLGTTPMYGEFAQTLNQRANDPNGFKNEVFRVGQFLSAQAQRTVPPNEVIDYMQRMYGFQSQGNSSNTQAPAMPAPATPQAGEATPPQAPQASDPKPVFPKVKARGAGVSPVKTRPKNINDLRKIAASRAATA